MCIRVVWTVARSGWGVCALACTAVLASSSIRAQSESNAHRSFGESVETLASFLAPLVLPKVANDDFLLRDYIRSEEFRALRQEQGDLHAVDAIFTEALRLSWNNTYEALFLSLIVTMDHRRFGVRLPLLGPLLWVPLTAEFPDEFAARVDALPRKLYDDTPAGPIGDRDKLQHFFGSALITFTFESREAAERIGAFIEWGEDVVIVDGALDERDIRANRQGQQFGLGLLNNPSVKPSAYLRFALARTAVGHDAGGARCGTWGMQEDR